jgi:hypothetical protein
VTDYLTLQADIADWTARTDLATKTPALIRLAEAEINRRVKVLEQEADVTLIANSGNDYAPDLPAGYLGFRRIHNGGPNALTVYTTPTVFHGLANAPADAFSRVIGDASLVYTIESNKLKVFQGSGGTDPITLYATYWKRFTALTTSAPDNTNWLLTNHYDVYLYAGLAAAWDFIDETEMVARYTARFDKALDQLDIQEAQKHMPAGPLVRRRSSGAIF